MDGNEDTARRIRAARALAGLNSVQALAARIGEPGLSTKTLRAIEQARRPANPRELVAIAKACGITVDFFRMDFTAVDLEQGTEARLENAESQVASLWATVTQLRREFGEVRSQVDELKAEAVARRQREAAERERRRRGTTPETGSAEGGR